MFYRFIMPPFRALALATWRKAVLDVSQSRAPTAPVATQEKTRKNAMSVYELAYSTTSFSARTSFLARRSASEQARQPEIV